MAEIVVGLLGMAIALLCNATPGDVVKVCHSFSYKLRISRPLIFGLVHMQSSWNLFKFNCFKYGSRFTDYRVFSSLCAAPLTGMFLLGGLSRKTTWQVK